MPSPDKKKPKLISGTGNPALTERIAEYCNLNIVQTEERHFSDGEFYIRINEDVRGSDVFIIQPTCQPGEKNLMELLITIDALKRGSAGRITAVIPYYGYARQDRKTASRTPITAKLVANLITTAGADRVLTMDLHAKQIQGFFDIPIDDMFARPVFIADLKDRYPEDDFIIVSPDVGGVVRARSLAKYIDANLAIIDKRRPGPNQAQVMNVIGDVTGKNCVLVDDMTDTAGTLCKAADALMEKGAKSVTAYCSHGLLTGDAKDKIMQSALENLTITDSIAPSDSILSCPKIRVISIAPLLGDAILRIHNEQSVSSLFDYGDDGTPGGRVQLINT